MRRKKRNSKKVFYNVLTVVFLVAIGAILYFLFFQNGGGAKKAVTKKPKVTHTAQPTKKPVATQPSSAEPTATADPANPPVTPGAEAQVLFGKWDSDTGVYLEVNSNGTLALGVTGNESEAAIYNYSVTGSSITIAFTDGDPATATFSVANAQTLTLQFVDSTLTLEKR